MDQKLEAIRAYGTQFHGKDLDEPQTYISSPDFLESVIYRSKMFGKMIGVNYAEGFISKKMIGFNNFDSFIKINTWFGYKQKQQKTINNVPCNLFK